MVYKILKENVLPLSLGNCQCWAVGYRPATDGLKSGSTKHWSRRVAEQPLTGAHYQELATALYFCHGVFTDEFIFRFEFTANTRLPLTRWAPTTNHNLPKRNRTNGKRNVKFRLLIRSDKCKVNWKQHFWNWSWRFIPAMNLCLEELCN